MVTVSRPLLREVTDWDEFPGRLAAMDFVEVRARVSGFLEQVPFEEGAIIKQGDLLFVLDAATYQAELNRAAAELSRAEAQQRFATGEFQRIDTLHRNGTASEHEYYTAREAMETAEANVAAARAAVDVARLNVEWCRVTAPISGRVGRKLVTPGNLISGGVAQSTLLTTITSLDPIHCYIDVDERTVQRYQRMVREGGRPSARDVPLRAVLAIGDQSELMREGYIDFINNRIDSGTGTISVRGVFPNADRQLLPGFFARVRVPGRGPYRALLVPEEAIGRNLTQPFLLTVGAEEVVQAKNITLGGMFEGLRAVDGIGPDDRIVINGMMLVRPGVKVRVQEVAVAPRLAASRPVTLPASRSTTPAQVSLGQEPSRSNDGPAEGSAQPQPERRESGGSVGP